MLSLRRTTSLITAASAIAAGALAAQAGAADERTVDRSRFLWATVNVCDTAKHPDTIGIRGSMPGARNGRERMYMRFRVQYYAAASQGWRYVSKANGGDSGWEYVGRARYESRQGGTLFTFRPPSSGSMLLRGLVTFKWVHGDRTVRSARKATRAGHPGTSGADPRTFSAETCEIKA